MEKGTAHDVLRNINANTSNINNIVCGTIQNPILVQVDSKKRGSDNEIKTEEKKVKLEDLQRIADPTYEEYSTENLKYHKDLEKRKRPRPNYMSKQGEVTSKMRSILVDWLVEVQIEFKLSTETIYLSISLLDRYLSRYQISKVNLQLTGVSCLLIASKIEDIEPPTVSDLVFLCDKAYTDDDIRRMEFHVLTSLNFDTYSISSFFFLNRFLKICSADKETELLALYFNELSLLDYYSIIYLPSEIAASSVILSLYTLNKPFWTVEMETYFEYKLDHLLKGCVPWLYDLHFNIKLNLQTQTVTKKYAVSSKLKVSSIPPKDYSPQLKSHDQS